MKLNYWLLTLSNALEGWWHWAYTGDGETFWVSRAAQVKTQQWKYMAWFRRTGSWSPACKKENEAGLETGVGPRSGGQGFQAQELRSQPRPMENRGRVLSRGVTDQDCGPSGYNGAEDGLEG